MLHGITGRRVETIKFLHLKGGIVACGLADTFPEFRRGEPFYQQTAGNKVHAGHTVLKPTGDQCRDGGIMERILKHCEFASNCH